MFAKLLQSEDDRNVSRNCFHEDGGVNAILEEVDVDVQVSVVVLFIHSKKFYSFFPLQTVKVVGNKNSIIVGCTHRVIWCDCPKNVSLQTFNDWCEWCKCENCGGKNGTFVNRYEHTPFSINLDALVALAMYVVAGVLIYYSRQQLYVILYTIAGVSAILLIRTLFTKHEITFA
jgi:hypothetical protein